VHKKTLLRWASAVVASIVCTAIGFSGAFYAYAEAADCTLKDVAAWKERLFDPTKEATPLYRLGVTEDFLDGCPDRPEAIEAHRVAGLAALDGEYVKAAKDHLQNARTPYQHLKPREWFGLMAAFVETGEEARAWQERDAHLRHWIDRLETDGIADITSTEVNGGVIHSVEFAALEPGDYVRGVWIAAPAGPGWPSAIVLGSSEFRSSMNRLRSGEKNRIEHIDLIGCRERITLTQSDGEIAFSTAKAAAISALETYLEEPEMPKDNGIIDLSSQCRWPGHMFPRPDPYKAALID